MSFFTRAAILFYVTIILFLGCFAVLYVLNVLSYKDIADLLYITYLDDHLRVAVGSIAVGLLFINFILYRQLDVNAHKEKIIAFDNPSGRVRVALVALEDLIRRAISRFPEVKEEGVGRQDPHGVVFRGQYPRGDVHRPGNGKTQDPGHHWAG